MATFARWLESSGRRGTVTAASQVIYEDLDLEDDRILIDIETERALRLEKAPDTEMESETAKPGQRIPHFLVEGRTLGPLSVLLILLLYSLLSPLLSPATHEYIYRILH